MTNPNYSLLQSQSMMAKKDDAARINGIALSIFFVLLAVDIFGATWMGIVGVNVIWLIAYIIGVFLLSLYFLFALKVANQWDKAVVLRLGKIRGLKGPGVFWLIPIIDTIADWIDHRVMVSPFSAEKTLTKSGIFVCTFIYAFRRKINLSRSIFKFLHYRPLV